MKKLLVAVVAGLVLGQEPAQAARRIVETEGQMFYDVAGKEYHFWITLRRHIAPSETNWCPGTEKVSEASWDFNCPSYPGLGCSKFTFGVTDTTGMIYTRSDAIQAAARYYEIATVGCFRNTPFEVVIVVDYATAFITGKIEPWIAGTAPELVVYLGKVHVDEAASLHIYNEQDCLKPTPRCGAVFTFATDTGVDQYEWKGAIHEVKGPPTGDLWITKGYWIEGLRPGATAPGGLP